MLTLAGVVAANRYVLCGYVASLPEVLRAMRKVRIWRVFQTDKFRVGKDHYCFKRTYKSEENARSQGRQGLKADRIGSSSSL